MRIQENIGMKREAIALLSPYETSIIRGTKNSRADLIVKDKRTVAILNSMLGAKAIVDLDDGTSTEATIEELLVASAIEKELSEPKGLETIERLARIRGELSDNKDIAVNVSLVDKDLAKRAIE